MIAELMESGHPSFFFESFCFLNLNATVRIGYQEDRHPSIIKDT